MRWLECWIPFKRWVCSPHISRQNRALPHLIKAGSFQLKCSILCFAFGGRKAAIHGANYTSNTSQCLLLFPRKIQKLCGKYTHQYLYRKSTKPPSWVSEILSPWAATNCRVLWKKTRELISERNKQLIDWSKSFIIWGIRLTKASSKY